VEAAEKEINPVLLQQIKDQAEVIRKLKNDSEDKYSPAIMDQVFKLLLIKVKDPRLAATEVSRLVAFCFFFYVLFWLK
jgi:hypothetical protein